MNKIPKKLFWIYILSGAIYFTQGIEGVPSLAFFLYLKEQLHFTPEKVMWLSSIIGIAWVVKPIYGFICDNFLNKKLWMLLSIVGSIAISFYFGLAAWLPLTMIIVMASLGNLTTAFRDVAADAVMCVEGKKEDSCDLIQSVQWISITIASVIVGLAGGYIAQHYNYKIGYLVLIPIYLVIGWIISKYRTVEPSNSTSISLIESVLSYGKLFTNKQFLLACLFLFLYKFSPSFGVPLSYIERDTFHWSAQWLGTLDAIISACSILGAIIFFKTCKIMNIKKWLTISVFLGAITSLCYLYFTPVSAIVYGVLFSVFGLFVHLIVMSFMAKSTLPGREATSFALLCSISNLAAGSASSMTGATLFPLCGLPGLIILSSLTSFLCLPLIKHLDIK